MTRRHKQALAHAAKMKVEDETERQRLLTERDSAVSKRDALKAMRDAHVVKIADDARDRTADTKRMFGELITDEDNRIAAIDRLVSDLEDGDEVDAMLGHNSKGAEQQAAE